MNIVTINEQEFDLDDVYLKIGETIYIRKDKVEDLMLGLVKKLIDEGKLLRNSESTDEDYFKPLNDL